MVYWTNLGRNDYLSEAVDQIIVQRVKTSISNKKVVGSNLYPYDLIKSNHLSEANL